MLCFISVDLKYMSIKCTFLNIWPKYVYGINTFRPYVDENAASVLSGKGRVSLGSPGSDSAGVWGNPGGANRLFCIWDGEVLAECGGGIKAHLLVDISTQKTLLCVFCVEIIKFPLFVFVALILSVWFKIHSHFFQVFRVKNLNRLICER